MLVTSRQRLSALAGAIFLNLEIMTTSEALELLSRLIGTEPVTGQTQACEKIVGLCGHLPLALRIAGGTIAARPHWTLADYSSRVADERRRLEQLHLGDLDVRASFELSYRDLGAENARLFRLLGLLMGRDFGAATVGGLVGLNTLDAEDDLEKLVAVQLVEPVGGGRYRFHDLVRLFAREKLISDESTEEQQFARLRLARWYVQVFTERAERVHASRERINTLQKAPEDIRSKAWKEYNQLEPEWRAWSDLEGEDMLTALDAAQAAGDQDLRESLWRIVDVFFV